VKATGQTVLFRFAAIGVASFCVIAVAAVGGAAVANATTAPTTVTASDIASATPTDGGWWQDRDSGDVGSFAMTADSYDGTDAVKLELPTSAAGIDLHDDYSTATRPTDLPALLSSASYAYTGTNVNFQIEVAYQPTDPQYGPSGTSPCTSASSWGIAGVDSTWCYALLKWEPFATTSTWSTVDLSANTAGNSGTVPTPTAGWLSQKRVGAYPATNTRVGQTLSNYLGQMADYQVVSVGFGAGSGAAEPAGWVKNMTIGGASYDFAPVADAPTPPPVANSTDLDSYITTNDVDVAATSSTFSIGGGPAGSGLTSIAPTTDFSATLPWTDDSDTFVDVYAYSTPDFLGTFPVKAGVVQLTGVDLSALQLGSHHLVFIGQTSGTLSIVAITLAATGTTTAADPTLAFTGTDAVAPAIGALVILLLGFAMVVVARSRGRLRIRGRGNSN